MQAMIKEKRFNKEVIFKKVTLPYIVMPIFIIPHRYIAYLGSILGSCDGSLDCSFDGSLDGSCDGSFIVR